jgi:DNA-binding IclR family transcriptional regulator
MEVEFRRPATPRSPPAREEVSRGSHAAIEFVRYNNRTITSKKELRRELARVVETGRAFDGSEQFEGVYRIGAPVFECGGYPSVSVWTTGLMMDLDRAHIPETGAAVRAHAVRIPARWGFGGAIK